MGFNLEGSKNNEINEVTEAEVDREKLSETEETAENFDDCSLNEVQDSKENEVNSESLENTEENYDDCEAKMEKIEEEKPELADADDDFNDCGKETEGQYVAEVTYTTDGEVEEEPEIEKVKENSETEEVHQNSDAEDVDNENIESEDLKQMDDDSNVEVSNIDEESASENISQEVEDETGAELSEDSQTEIRDEVTDEINDEAEEGNISAAEAEEIAENKVKAKTESVESEIETIDDEIGNRAEEVTENDNLTTEEAKEEVSDKVTDFATDSLSEEDTEAIVDEKVDVIEDTIEEKGKKKGKKKENIEAVEKVADELETEQAEQSSEQTQLSLQERIDGVFEKDEVSASEINGLREENAAELKTKIEEKELTESELKSKFDEVLSKAKGSDEYKRLLNEYNAIKDKKTILDEQITSMEEQQDFLDKKSLELRDAQIQKGTEAVAASAATLAGVSALQERYDQTYYDTKPDKGELANIREESCSTIKELTAEKDSIKQAMDAKMEEISEYVTSNNMDRYDTAHDLRYQQLSAEYNAMRESYDRIRYSIVKLDENNKAITEHLGDEYVSMAELPPASRISEVNTGTDIPGETNYFVDESKAAEVLSPFKQGNWEQLSINEQKQAIEKLADYNAEILGVEDKPRIIFFNKPPQDGKIERGNYDPTNNSIFINEYCLNDSAGIADTVSHEYRHKYQHLRADKLENERDLEFKESFDNYIRAEDDYQGYKNQLVETDARAYAAEFQNRINAPISENATIDAIDKDDENNVTNYSEMNPKRGAVWDGSHRFDSSKIVESKLEISEQSEKNGFLTNDGERITYDEAVERITDSAKNYMKSMGVDKNTQDAVLNDMRVELYKQQEEAMKRGIGDHGVRHIYGIFERGEKYLASRNDVSNQQKMAVLVAMVYHDDGYTVSPSNLGTLNEGNSDKKHDEASLKQWDKSKKLYSFLSSETMTSIDKAIGEHNVGSNDKLRENERGLAYKVDSQEGNAEVIAGADRIKENTSKETDIIVSTVHICDKLALSQREKFSELLSNDHKLVELTEGMNSTFDSCRRLGLCDKSGKPTGEGRDLYEKYHAKIYEYIDRKWSDNPEYAKKLKDAVSKDVGINSGKFSSRMNYIYTPSDCYQYNPETERNEITVYVIDYANDTSTDLSYKQVDKMLEDLGLSDEKIKVAKADGGYDFGEEQGLSVKIKSITEDEIKEIESAKFQENNDLKEVNESIEAGRKKFNEFSQTLAEIAAAKEAGDISLDDYFKVANEGKIVVDFTEDEFDALSEQEKERLVKEAISKMLELKVSNILGNRKGG